MLETVWKQNPQTGMPKSLECIRVDGESNEGPCQCYIAKKRVATLITTWSSRSSYLTKVELHNGCSSLGHASYFILSTLAASCLSD